MKKICMVLLTLTFIITSLIIVTVSAQYASAGIRGALEKDRFTFRDSSYFSEQLSKIGARNIDTDVVYIVSKTRSFRANYFTTANSAESTNAIYLGELNKEGRPHGKGIVFSKRRIATSDRVIERYIPSYCGNFKNGEMSGYGVLYATAAIYSARDDDMRILVYKQYEGGFSKNMYSGKGNEIRLEHEISRNNIIFIVREEEDNTLYDNLSNHYLKMDNYFSNTNIENHIFADVPIVDFPFSTCIVGRFSKDVKSGSGKMYIDDILMFDGKYKNGLPHGKGTLYNKDGSIAFKGNWKKGDPQE